MDNNSTSHIPLFSFSRLQLQVLYRNTFTTRALRTSGSKQVENCQLLCLVLSFERNYYLVDQMKTLADNEQNITAT